MSNVCIRNLRVGFDGHDILNRLDLDVAEGEFLVLLGPSGCGKSTLLHSIAGLNEVMEGSIEIGDKDMTWVDPSERNIGMVFQSYALYPTMTVERNLSFALRIKGMDRDEIERRVKRAAEILHLESLLQRKPAQLSGGQRQRVAIGRALVKEAGVFLLDEPLSNLDAKLRTELRRELKLLHQRLRSTMIYVTHDQTEAMTLASRIVVMREGCIQQIGTPQAVYVQPENLFVAGFLGSPCMNFLNGKLANRQGTIHFLAPGFEIYMTSYSFRVTPTNGQTVMLGIRPEHVHIRESGAQKGVVTMVEPMGNHHIVWIDCGGALMSCLARGEADHRPDAEVRFDIDAERACLFGADERRL